MRLSGKWLSRLLVIAIVPCLMGSATGAMAGTATRAIGNSDGTPFRTECPAGEALAGWLYNATDRLTAIGPLCQKVEDTDDGPALTGDQPSTPDNVYGADMPGAGSGDPVFCGAKGGIIRSLQVFLTANLQVHSIRGVCKAPHNAPQQVHATATNGGPSTAQSSVGCTTPAYATGLIGTYKPSLSFGGILSLGLICFDGKSDQADATPPDADDNAAPPADTETADTGDNDDSGFTLQININGNGINFGPKGKVRVTRDTTTLYADKGKTEIDYFDKGQKVVVLGCEKKGKGWCQVIKPKPGLIWGGDLN